MTIDALAQKSLEKMEDGEYKTNMIKVLKAFGSIVVKEIYRLNFPAFSCLEDDDYTKQGFVNAMLNCLVDEDSPKFPCSKAWNGVEVSPPRNRMLIVERGDKLYFAKYDDQDNWVSQDGEIYEDVDRWREFLVQLY